jgi:nucleoside diphosphate kinase
MVVDLCAGPLVAVEVTGADAVARVRAIVGPRDVEVGRRVR